MSKFDAILAETLTHEGGWSDHPDDPGGATMRGITLATFRRRQPGATKEDLRRISDADLRHIYRVDYWRPVRGDDLPAGIDMATFDAAVNSGVTQGSKWTQRALQVTADGRIGTATLAAAAAADPVPVIRKACELRMGMLRGLKTWGAFGRGWSRRVASVEARAVAMAQAHALAPARPVLLHEQDQAYGNARRDETAAVGTGVATPSAATLADLPVWAWVILGAAALLAVVLLMGQRRYQLDRAEAFGRIAREVAK